MFSTTVRKGSETKDRVDTCIMQRSPLRCPSFNVMRCGQRRSGAVSGREDDDIVGSCALGRVGSNVYNE